MDFDLVLESSEIIKKSFEDDDETTTPEFVVPKESKAVAEVLRMWIAFIENHSSTNVYVRDTPWEKLSAFDRNLVEKVSDKVLLRAAWFAHFMWCRDFYDLCLEGLAWFSANLSSDEIERRFGSLDENNDDDKENASPNVEKRVGGVKRPREETEEESVETKRAKDETSSAAEPVRV